MIHRFIYQQKPVYTQADTALFSKGDFTCIRLYLTKKGKPVALSEGNSAAHYKWRVQYGFSPVWFSKPMRRLSASAVSAFTIWTATP